jgi:hypothetical protein
MKPIQWMGTQRSAFTHRKDNQRSKIKHLLVKLKKARDQHEEIRKERAIAKDIK